MKTLMLSFATCLASVGAFAQSSSAALGQYAQEAFIGPDEVKTAEKNVVLVKDATLPKVVWVQNLLPGGRVKAVLHTKTEDKIVYSIPAQRVGSYQINMGCAIYDQDDSKLVISLNNKANCFGMAQSDYDGGVAVGSNGRIKAGGVDINGRNGSIKTPGVNVGKGGVAVNTKAIMAGVQYVGHKAGSDD